MNRVIVMFVALFIGVFGSAYLMIQGSHRPGLPQGSSEAKKTDNSQTKDDEGKISAVESKATFNEGNPPSAKSGADAKSKETSPRSSGDMVTKNGDGQSKVRKVASSSRPADSSARASSNKTRRVYQKPTATSKVSEPVDNRWDEDLDKLQGSWQIVDAENDGQSNRDEAKHYTWEIKDNKYTINCDGHFQELWAMRLNSGRITKTIDGTHDITGKKLMGIYEIKGDNLRICYDLTGNGRPDSFKAGKGDRRVVYILQRQ
ncbi:MAG TPA: TIGR03067 domain-containing protein [Gemmataceae bacterium]|jgi:uncharacterized protein (TIGR03067 family)|nr:TIGR03067 domain-containing protein [Gemmataceae bacterium]